MSVSFFLQVLSEFRSDNYTASYAWDAERNTSTSSFYVSIIAVRIKLQLECVHIFQISISNFIKIRSLIPKLKDADGHAENSTARARTTGAEDQGHTYDGTKFAHKLCIMRFLVKNKLKILNNVCPVTFSFQDKCYSQMVQGIKWPNHWRFVIAIGVRSDLRPLQCRRQCAARNSLEHTLTYWHRPLSQLLGVLPRSTSIR